MVAATQARVEPNEVAAGSHLADSLRRAPLMVKVGGSSLPLLATVLLVAWWNLHLGALPRYALGLVLLMTVATAVAHLALVAFAWQPIDRVRHAVESFANGDEEAVVVPSAWSDQGAVRLERNVDRLFDVVRRGRARYRHLAGRVLREMDEEQGQVARELFDSTAQSMAALLLELRAVATGIQDPRLLARVDGVRQIAAGVLEDVKLLSQDTNPRWQARDGLQGALQHLVREHNDHSEARLLYDAPGTADPTASSLVYRTTRAALRLAAQERCPGVDVSVLLRGDRMVLEVIDARARVAMLAGAPSAESLDLLGARAELLGGSLQLNRDGDRRRLRLEVPIDTVFLGEKPLMES
jgi:signal transduction histidine kinase